MAASLDTNVKLPYKSVVRRIVTRNVVALVPVLIFLNVSLSGSPVFNSLTHPLLSCKVFMAVISCLEFFSWFVITQKSQKKMTVLNNCMYIYLYCNFRISQCLALTLLRVINFFKCCATAAVFSGLFHCVAILFGAPFLSSSAETYHFAMVLTATTIIPASCVLGPPSTSWIKIYFLNIPELGMESVIHIISICSVVGAWLGAIPIPLDWDRPWQVWPISCVLGNLFGYCAGLVISSLHLLYHTRNRKSKLF